MLIVHRHLYVDFKKEKEFRIRPHSDLQFGNPDTDIDLVKRTIRETAEDPLCVALGAGDIIDTDRPSTRIRRITAYAGREAELTQDDMKRMAWLDKEVVPMFVSMADNPNVKRGFGLLGEIDGHHWEAYQNGTTSTEYLMNCVNNKLKREDHNQKSLYLGEMMCYVILHVHGTNANSHQGFQIIIHLQHGTGGSQFLSGDMQKLERQTSPYFVADVFLRGHSTKKYAAMRPILYPSKSEDNPQLMEKTMLLVNTGGYMKGYGPGPKANYVESMGLAPVTLGHVVIHVKIKCDSVRNSSYYPEYTIEL